MTRLLLANHLRLLARARGLRMLAVVYAAALAVGTLALLPVPFVDTTAAAGTPALDVAWWLWAILTPWWVSRFLSVERGDAAVMLSAQVGATPQEAVRAQLGAAFVFAGELALMSLPIGMVAYASGRSAAADVLATAAALAALSALAIVVTFHCSLRSDDRLASWAGATVVTIGAAVGFPYLTATIGRAPAVALFALGAVVLAWVLPLRARRELMYLAS